MTGLTERQCPHTTPAVTTPLNVRRHAIHTPGPLESQPATARHHNDTKSSNSFSFALSAQRVANKQFFW